MPHTPPAPEYVPPPAPEGREWLVEAHGCDPAPLGDVDALRALFAAMVADLGLHPVGDPLWHKFPGPGGVTGMVLLAESHLTVHTFPEHGSLCLNLFCCRPRPEWAFEAELRARFGAAEVVARSLVRPYAAAVPS